MKVAMISFSNNYDMQEKIYSMSEELRKENIDSVTFGSASKIYDPNSELVNNLLFDVPNKPGITLKTFNIFLFYKIVRKIRKINPNILFFESSHVWNLLLIKIFKNKKIIHVIHDIFPHENEKNSKNVVKYNSFITKKCDLILIHNDKYRTDLKEFYKINEKKIKFIPLWNKKVNFFKPKNSKEILFFGRMNPYKGINYIPIIANALDGYKVNVVGNFIEETKKYLDVLSEIENVRIINSYVDYQTMSKYIYNSEIVILPYNSATQSGIILESYKHSRPVIAFDVGAIKEQVIDNNTGFLIEKGNIQSFNKELKKYLKLKKKDKDQICRNSWIYWNKKYNVENISKKLVEILRSIDQESI